MQLDDLAAYLIILRDDAFSEAYDFFYNADISSEELSVAVKKRAEQTFKERLSVKEVLALVKMTEAMSEALSLIATSGQSEDATLVPAEHAAKVLLNVETICTEEFGE